MTTEARRPSWAAETLGEHINTAATLIHINADSALQCCRDLGQRMLDAGIEAMRSNSHLAVLHRTPNGPQAVIPEAEPDETPQRAAEEELEGELADIIGAMPELWE